MKTFLELKELIESAEKDAGAFFDKNNNAAGTRLRGALQKVKALAQDIRNEVTTKKNQGK